MGQFLSSIDEVTDGSSKGPTSFCCQPLQKIYEFHSIFKSVCDSFSVNRAEFQQIFGSQSSFTIWQKQQSQRLDALQMFAGLAVFSQGTVFKEKLRFLFELFDFNQVRSISTIDLEYMMVCICNSTLRILSKNAKVSNAQIVELVRRLLGNDHRRVIITTLLKKCIANEQIRRFFQLIGKQMQQHTADEVISKNSQKLYFQEPIQDQNVNIKAIETQQKAWYNKLAKKLAYPTRKQNVNSKCYPRWVFGMETNRVQQPFIQAEGSIIYAVSSIAVIYLLDENQQRIYNQHTNRITCITYCKSKQLVVTGQEGPYPRIHVWSYTTMQTVRIIETTHLLGLTSLLFVDGDSKLFTVGSRSHNSVLLYSTDKFQTIISSCLPGCTFLGFSTVKSYYKDLSQSKKQVSRSIVAFTSQDLYLIQAGLHIPYKCYKPEIKTTKITVACGLYANYYHPSVRSYSTDNEIGIVILTGHENGDICVTVDNYAFRQIVNLPGQISHIGSFDGGIGVAVSSMLLLYELDLIAGQIQPFAKIDLMQQLNLTLLSQQIAFFSMTSDNELLILTKHTDLILVTQLQTQFDGKAQFIEKFACKKINTIFSFNGSSQALSIIEKQDCEDRIVFCCCDEQRIIGISLQTHQIIDMWRILDQVTVVDSASCVDGIIIFVLGCRSGKVYIRIDWEESPRCYDCSSQIVQVKLAYDASYLLVCTKDRQLYVFTNSNNSFVSQAPRKIQFDNESPCSVEFADDNRSFLVCMDSRNVYQFYLPELKHKNPLSDNELMHISQLHATFCLSNQKETSHHLPGLIGGDQKVFFLTDPRGNIHCYQNSDEMESNSFTTLSGHTGPISRLLMTSQQDCLLSLSDVDNMLVQWAVDSFTQTQQKKPIIAKAVVSDQRINSLKTTSKQSIPSQSFILCGGVNNNLIQTSLNQKKPHQQDVKRLHPNMSLKPEYVYGFECSTKKQSLFYSRAEFDQIIFFNSRFTVYLNTESLQQRIIEKPTTEVSCIALSDNNILAIGEACQDPCIYLRPDKKIRTAHTHNIIHMSFYGDLLYSFGQSDSTYSINIHDCRTGVLVASRMVSQYIHKFNILKKDVFVSINNIRIWENLYPSEILGQACCSDIIKQHSDILLGSPQGHLLILTNNKLLIAKQQAHTKAILSLRYNSNSQMFRVVTAGADQIIKIWDGEFHQKASIQLRSQQIISFLTQQNGTILPDQPLHVYNLDAKQDNIIAAISNGQLFRIQLQTSSAKTIRQQAITSSFMISQVLITDRHLSELESYEFKFTQLMVGFPRSCDSSVCFSLHPHLPIIASSCSNSVLTAVNYLTKQTIASYFLEEVKITNIKFSPNEKFLAVGCQNGALRLYELRIKYSKDATPNKLTLILSQCFETLTSSIIGISFSSCSTFIAVSYLPSAVGNKQYDDNLMESPRSRIALLLNRDLTLGTQGNYYKYDEVKQCISQPFRIDDSGRAVCATTMTFVGKGDDMCLIIYYQSVTPQGTRMHCDPKAEYKVFHIKSKTFLKDEREAMVDWSTSTFPNSIQACKILQSGAGDNSSNVTMTQMAYYGKRVIYGSVNGQLYIVDRESIALTDSKPANMYLAKTQCGLTSQIYQLELTSDGRYLFVTSTDDSCIFQMSVAEQQDAPIQLSNINTKQFDIRDWEVLSKDTFYNYTNNALPARQLISSVLEDIQSQLPCQVELTPVMTIGRRAFDRRKNMFFDGKDSIMYSLGPTIVLEELNSDGDSRKQSFRKADPSETSCSPQISCFVVDVSCELMAVSTEQDQSKIIVWSIHTGLCLSRTLVNCTIVQGLNFSKNKQYISLYGISKSYYPLVAVLDWKRSVVVCQADMLYSPVWLIKDMQFHQTQEFITCGVQHLSIWSCGTSKLTFEQFNLSQTSNVTFTAVAVMKSKIVTACETGYIYLWESSTKTLVSKIKAHQAAVRCLLVRGGQQLISGGMDARVCTFELKPHNLNKKTQQLLCQSEDNGQSKLFSARYDIQSMVDNKGSLFIGTRSGDIYKLKKSETPQQILWSSDQEKPVSAVFNEDSTMLLTLTNMGYLQMCDLKTNRMSSYHFRKRFLKMLRFKNCIMLVMERNINVVQIKGSEPVMLQQYNVSCTGLISDARLSLNQKMLIIATANSDKSELHIYDVENDGFKLVKSHSLSAQVQFIDFSVDDKYILLKDKAQELGIIETRQLKRINTIFIEYDIEWSSDGIVINEKAMNIHSCYHRENTITKMLQLEDKYVLVADQVGSLRLFDYPCQNKRVGELHLRCYTQHMNFISSLEKSPDGRWVASVSQMDRAIILWRITHAE